MKPFATLLKRSCFFNCFLCLLFIFPFTANDRPLKNRLATSSGEELVRMLLSPWTIQEAFAELSRRASLEDWIGREQFDKRKKNLSVVVCPQKNIKAPLYLVLYECSPPFDDFLAVDAGEIHEEKPWENQTPESPFCKKRLHVEAFTSKGKKVTPFGNNSILNRGLLMDINGDGLIERLHRIRSNIFEMDILIVQTVISFEKLLPQFAVLYNWKTRDWGYNIRDNKLDGIYEIELGPGQIGAITPVVTFKWDSVSSSYKGSHGKAEDHFRVLDIKGSKTLREELNKLKQEGLKFPKDLDDLFEMDKKHRDHPVQASEKARHGVPKTFWSSSPKKAALDFMQFYRTPHYKEEYLVALDDRDGKGPPDRCAITFYYYQTHRLSFYNHLYSIFTLYCHPADSFITLTSESYWENRHKTEYDLRFVKIPYTVARHISQVIWWMHRVVVKSRSKKTTIFMDASSIDPWGALVFNSPKWRNDGFFIEGSFSRSIPSLWGKIGLNDRMLNLGFYLIAEILPAKIGQEWHNVRSVRPFAFYHNRIKTNEEKKIIETSNRFLTMFDPSTGRIPIRQVVTAVEIIEELHLSELKTQLLRIKEELKKWPLKQKLSLNRLDVEREILDKKMNVYLTTSCTPMHYNEMDLCKELLEFYHYQYTLAASGLSKNASLEWLRHSVHSALAQLQIIDKIGLITPGNILLCSVVIVMGFVLLHRIRLMRKKAKKNPNNS